MTRAADTDDLTTQIAALAETLTNTAKTEIRTDLATEVAAMLKRGDDAFRDYLRPDGDQPAYLPGVDADTWTMTPEFQQGIQFMIALLKDANFEH